MFSDFLVIDQLYLKNLRSKIKNAVPHLLLVTLLMLHGHMWLVAAVLNSMVFFICHSLFDRFPIFR